MPDLVLAHAEQAAAENQRLLEEIEQEVVTEVDVAAEEAKSGAKEEAPDPRLLLSNVTG